MWESVSVIGIWDFEFVSDFEFRASDFHQKTYRIVLVDLKTRECYREPGLNRKTCSRLPESPTMR